MDVVCLPNDLPSLITNRRHSLFGHICQLSMGTPVSQALRLSIDTFTGTPPATEWKRLPGRPRRTSWRPSVPVNWQPWTARCGDRNNAESVKRSSEWVWVVVVDDDNSLQADSQPKSAFVTWLLTALLKSKFILKFSFLREWNKGHWVIEDKFDPVHVECMEDIASLKFLATQSQECWLESIVSSVRMPILLLQLFVGYIMSWQLGFFKRWWSVLCDPESCGALWGCPERPGTLTIRHQKMLEWEGTLLERTSLKMKQLHLSLTPHNHNQEDVLGNFTEVVLKPIAWASENNGKRDSESGCCKRQFISHETDQRQVATGCGWADTLPKTWTRWVTCENDSARPDAGFWNVSGQPISYELTCIQSTQLLVFSRNGKTAVKAKCINTEKNTVCR